MGAGKMILRHALRYPESMVRLRGICLIHPAELRPKNCRNITRLPPENNIHEKVSGDIGAIGGYEKPVWPKLGGISSDRPCRQSAQDTLRHSQIGKRDPENNIIYIYILGICPKYTRITGTEFRVKFLPWKYVPWLYKIYTGTNPACVTGTV